MLAAGFSIRDFLGVATGKQQAEVATIAPILVVHFPRPLYYKFKYLHKSCPGRGNEDGKAMLSLVATAVVGACRGHLMAIDVGVGVGFGLSSSPGGGLPITGQKTMAEFHQFIIHFGLQLNFAVAAAKSAPREETTTWPQIDVSLSISVPFDIKETVSSPH